MLRTLALLIASNVFMTLAWYGHLKYKGIALWQAILVSWGIAFIEYCLMVPANRLGYSEGMSAYQLKLSQEVITLLVFILFATFFLGEPFKWKYIISFVLLLASVAVAFKK